MSSNPADKVNFDEFHVEVDEDLSEYELYEKYFLSSTSAKKGIITENEK